MLKKVDGVAKKYQEITIQNPKSKYNNRIINLN